MRSIDDLRDRTLLPSASMLTVVRPRDLSKGNSSEGCEQSWVAEGAMMVDCTEESAIDNGKAVEGRTCFVVGSRSLFTVQYNPVSFAA